MVKNAADIQTGMDVYCLDGEKLGSVADIYPNAGFGATSDTSRQAGTTLSEGLEVETVDRAGTTPGGGTAFGDSPASTSTGYTTTAPETATSAAGTGTMTST